MNISIRDSTGQTLTIEVERYSVSDAGVLTIFERAQVDGSTQIRIKEIYSPSAWSHLVINH